MLTRFREWAADRFGLKHLHATTLDRRVPKSPWYFGDGATLTLLLGVLVATGIAMAFTYSPHVDAAYPSVRHLTERQFFGRFVRSLHYWSAGAMVVMLFWHLLRQILIGGYKAPREGTWLVGVGLLVGVLIMSYTGYLLRWDERAIHGVRVALHIVSRVPFVGEELVLLVQGGRDPGALLLTRIYAVHVLLIPTMIGGLLAWHLYLVLLHGTTTQREQRQVVKTAEEQRQIYKSESQAAETGETFYPETIAQSGAMAFIVLGLVVALALIFGPGPLMPEANLTDRSFPAEEWWWWWFSGLVAFLPEWLAPAFVVVFPILTILALLALPLIDRSGRRGIRARPWAAVLVVGIAVSLVALSGWRMRSPWTGWPTPDPPALPGNVAISAEAERGRQLFALQGCTSCHSVAGQGGRRVAVDLAHLDPPRSRQHLHDYIRQPPDDVAMPAYEGWATDEQIERLVDYVLAAQTFPPPAMSVGAKTLPRPHPRFGRWLAATLLIVTSLATGCHPGHQQSSLHPASEEAAQIARLWWAMCGVLGVAFIIVIALTLRAVFVRAAEPGRPPGGGHRFVVIGGIVVPAVILIAMLIYSLHVTLAQRRPTDGVPIQIIGHQWWWEVRYPDTGGITANELYLPVGEPVLLELWAGDVIHSFWVPNLHGKIDLVPEVKNRFWLTADRPGTWRGVCAEFCGRQHALMAFTVTALPRPEFDAWLEQRQRPRDAAAAGDDARIARGENIFFEAACHTCHAIRDTRAEARIGPDLTHLGSRPTLAAGVLPNNAENLARWIAEPQAVKPGNRMPATALARDDLADLVAYLQSLH